MTRLIQVFCHAQVLSNNSKPFINPLLICHLTINSRNLRCKSTTIIIYFQIYRRKVGIMANGTIIAGRKP